MNNVTLNTKRPMKGTSIRLGITCSSLFPGASAGLIVKAKSMPTLPWYAIKFIVSGILHFILSTFGVINLLIYGAYIKKWWQNIIESIFCLNSYMVADGAGEIFFHVRWRNWACTAQEFGSARQTSKRSTQRCWLFLWRLWGLIL